ncbi:DUF424 domain-containing protein [Methanocella sp. CWC-04]|uniref:DUF424 domain-containing protein n=1 Tax=Methanooceanicella nereidis TaxID=2052831 RepID=A0AAP2W5U7_9EURY|nr:DUF424 family protein [Methanocella sp. CWC-04]MCD1293684.1 DUF424 domain-containing protein [Methanocella sp. CWC-04]
MYLKVYRIDNEVLVAVCDEKYLGRELLEGDLQLKVSKEFYGDSTATREEIADALKDATVANLVGEESVAVAVDLGLVDTGHIIFIQNIPHAQMVRV